MRLLILAMFLLVATTFFVDTTPAVSNTDSPPITTHLVLAGEIKPQVSARAYGVFDIETGKLLFSQNQDEQLPIASVTKLFTAAQVLKSEQDDTELNISEVDVATEGRAGKLKVGQVYKTHELLFPLLLESSNDAATALERSVGSIYFGDRQLADASGLSSYNEASVSELATEVRRLYHEVPHLFDITTLGQYVGEYTGWVNNSPVRNLPGYRGGKHGYTEAAGKTLAAVFAESKLTGRELGYVLLGSSDLEKDVEILRATVEQSVHLESVQ